MTPSRRASSGASRRAEIPPRHGRSVAASPAAALAIELLDRFRLAWSGTEVAVQPRGVLLIAFVALHDRPISRSTVAGTLWPMMSERRALAALRATLHRIEAPVIAAGNDHLALEPRARVDLHEAMAMAREIARSEALPEETEAIFDTLKRDLLPECDGVWIEPHRERYRHLRLGALDSLAGRLSAAGRFTEAVEAAQLATTIEPASETAETALISSLLAEGNEALAVREYEAFRRRLWRDLRIRPAQGFDELRRRRGRHAAVTPR
jgi:DNA-binding SARP family transcriptional activator